MALRTYSTDPPKAGRRNGPSSVFDSKRCCVTSFVSRACTRRHRDEQAMPVDVER